MESLFEALKKIEIVKDGTSEDGSKDLDEEIHQVRSLAKINKSLDQLKKKNICFYRGFTTFPTINVEHEPLLPMEETTKVNAFSGYWTYEIFLFAKCSLENVKFIYHINYTNDEISKIIKDNPYSVNEFVNKLGPSRVEARSKAIHFYRSKGFLIHSNLDEIDFTLDYKDKASQKFIDPEIKKIMEEKGMTYEEYMEEMGSYYGDLAYSEYKDQKAVRAVEAWNEEGEKGEKFSEFMERNKDKEF